ncbi:MAG: transcription antitermination factor NusB [Acidimicrobiia bacterium]
MSREPRDQALERLYQADLLERAPELRGLSPKAKRLAGGVAAQQADLDETLEDASDTWRLHRMPAVDRAILRMGLYELRNSPEVPTAVVVSEAVRLAKTYSTERSGAFVNGVLGSLARRERSATS